MVETINDLRDSLAEPPTTFWGRSTWIYDKFSELGEVTTTEVTRHGGEVIPEARNVEFEVVGLQPTLEKIYVTAHHDFVPVMVDGELQGKGVVDNWSSVIALHVLSQQLLLAPLLRSVVFVSFDLEEPSQYGIRVGSESYVSKLASPIHANVNLECLGVGPLTHWTYDRWLADVQTESSRFCGMPSDSSSFSQHGLPSMVFDGIGSVLNPKPDVIHSRDDNIDAIDLDVYEQSLQHILDYLGHLDLRPSHTPQRPSFERSRAFSFPQWPMQ